jgi:transcriptional regulator with XRE-family HTH domain
VQRNRIRELRENKLLTQQQLADRAGLSQGTIYRVECGASSKPRTKRKILLALGVRFEDYNQVFLD